MIRPCDRLLLLPVYDAGGTADRSLNSDSLAARLPQGRCELVQDLDGVFEWCRGHLRDFGAFVTCGARDPGLPGLAARISAMRQQEA